jgi:hypothetical protein
MPARRTARRAVPGTAVLILSCAALAGCGSSGGSSPSAASAPSSGGSSPSAGNASAHNGKLTGNFCTDLKNIGTNIRIPPANASDPAAIQRRDSRYLNQVVAYYNKLASEAPPQAGKDIRLVASAYQRLASSIASESAGSLGKLEQQVAALTSSGAVGNAFKQLIVYVTTKCA